MCLQIFEGVGRWNTVGFPRSKNHFAILSLGVMLVLMRPGTARAFRDYLANCPNACNTPGPISGPTNFPPFYPTVDDTLPQPLSVEVQLNLSSPPLSTFVANQYADTTVSAWVHIPSGNAVTVYSFTGSAGIWGSRLANRFGIGATSVLGDAAASILNLPSDSLPKYFAFFDGMDFPSHYYFRSIGLGDVATLNINGVDWIHVTAGWAIGDMGVYEGGILHQLDEQNHLLGVLNPPFADVGAFQNFTGDSPPFGDDKFGGRVGQLAVYPNLIAPNLVLQLDATNPFGVPEPSTFASLAIGLLALQGFSRERLRSL
jgi:hypothetical protein